jgi:hypothetical protein
MAAFRDAAWEVSVARGLPILHMALWAAHAAIERFSTGRVGELCRFRDYTIERMLRS